MAGHRPFSSVDEMNEHLIYIWNALIHPSDVVYHLGDFCFTKNAQGYFGKLKGHIKIIQGNHDKSWYKKNKELFSLNAPVEKIHPEHEIRIDGNLIVLSHYAMRTWNKSHYGSIHLYGHSHGALPPFGLSMDVGIDTSNFLPYSLDDILLIMKSRKSTQTDYPIYYG